MIVYLAGNITNNDNYKKEFKQAEKELKEKGYIVLNPAKLPEGMAKEQYMPICLAMLEQTNWMVIVNDGDNQGVEIERRYAEYQGIPVLTLEEVMEIPTLDSIITNIGNVFNKFIDTINKTFGDKDAD